jgi:hypothetical protein
MGTTATIRWCGLLLDIQFDTVVSEYGYPELITIDFIKVSGQVFEDTDRVIYEGITLDEWLENKISKGDYI